MDIGVKKEEGRYHYEKDWQPRELAFNRTDTGVLVIASVPTDKRYYGVLDVMFGSLCEIHLFPDGTYWGKVNGNFIGCQRQPRPPSLPKHRDGCQHHPSCDNCPEEDCIA